MSLQHKFVTGFSVCDWFVLVSMPPASRGNSLINATFIKPQNCTEFQDLVPARIDLTACIASTLVGLPLGGVA